MEEVASQLDLTIPIASTAGGTNYAWGGARTGFGIDELFGSSFPTIGWQIEDYLRTNAPGDGSLIIVYAGENDLNEFAGPRSPAETVANLSEHISALAAAGGKHFVVPNMVPMGYYPWFRQRNREQHFNAITEEFNGLLATEMDMLTMSLDADIHELDFFGLVNAVMDDPAAFGLTNVMDPALEMDVIVPNAN